MDTSGFSALKDGPARGMTLCGIIDGRSKLLMVVIISSNTRAVGHDLRGLSNLNDLMK